VVLARFEASAEAAAVCVLPAPRQRAPRSVRESCAPDPVPSDPSRQSFFARAMLLPPGSLNRHGDPDAPTDGLRALAGRILSDLLVGGPASPMAQALVESKLGTSLCPGAGLHMHTLEAEATFGVKGMREADGGRVRDAVQSTLERVATDGFPQARVASTLHQLELALKRKQADFGLTVMHATAAAWTHGDDVVDALRVTDKMDALKELARDERYFPGLVSSWLLDNPHTLDFEMHPDRGFEAEQQQRESARLQREAAELSSEAREALARRAVELREAQEAAAAQDVSCLPTLAVGDIPRTMEPTPSVASELPVGGVAVPLQVVEQPVSDLVYLRWKLDLGRVPDRLWPYLPLFASLLTRLGTDKLDFRELSTAVDSLTGGIGVGVHCVSNPATVDEVPELALAVGTHCLADRLPRATELVADVLTRTRWSEVEQAERLIARAAASASDALSSEGHGVALGHASRGTSAASWYAYSTGGLPALRLLHRLAAAGREGAEEVLGACEEIAKHALVAPSSSGTEPPAKWSSLVLQQGGDRALVSHLLAHDAPPLRSRYDSRGVGAAARVVASGPHVADAAAAAQAVLEAFPAAPAQRAAATANWAFAAKQLLSSHSQDGAAAARTFVDVPGVGINFGALSAATGMALAHPDCPSLSVLSELLSSRYLHRHIREMRGAYGAGASHGGGAWSMFSYYDPELQETASSFLKSLDWACAGSFEERDVQESLLAVFSSVDHPRAPSEKGRMEFMHGVPDELRQARRERYLATDRAALVQVAEQYLAGLKANASITFVGSAERHGGREGLAKDGWKVMSASPE